MIEELFGGQQAARPGASAANCIHTGHHPPLPHPLARDRRRVRVRSGCGCHMGPHNGGGKALCAEAQGNCAAARAAAARDGVGRGAAGPLEGRAHAVSEIGDAFSLPPRARPGSATESRRMQDAALVVHEGGHGLVGEGDVSVKGPVLGALPVVDVLRERGGQRAAGVGEVRVLRDQGGRGRNRRVCGREGEGGGSCTKSSLHAVSDGVLWTVNGASTICTLHSPVFIYKLHATQG